MVNKMDIKNRLWKIGIAGFVLTVAQIGDGKIFVLDLAECIRIRTGDKGKKAIG